MDEASKLSHATILVVEDDFYLADDIRQVLERAGARVLGPCASAMQALSALDGSDPDCAVVDINLGLGPNFDLARAITARGIPMVFTTGYDEVVIPANLSHIRFLRKPVDLRVLTAMLADIRGSSPVER